MLKELPKDSLMESATTPAVNHTFTVDDESTKLYEDDVLLFHHYVVRLLFLSKRVRSDIHTDVVFVCICVTQPDVRDDERLMRIMRYLCKKVAPFDPGGQ